jgi:hypothetical protein
MPRGVHTTEVPRQATDCCFAASRLRLVATDASDLFLVLALTGDVSTKPFSA